MKKKRLSFLAIIWALILCFSLSGCAGTLTLSFKNSFVGNVSNSEIPPYLTETLTYEINYAEKYYVDYIAKNSKVTDDVVKYEFGKGSYVQTLKIMDRLPIDVNTDITGSKIYHIHSEMIIPVKYACNGEDLASAQTNIDTIVSDVYFLASDLSFAPIYSKSTSVNTYLNLLNYTTAETAKIEITSETVYNKTSYKMTVDIKSTNMVDGQPNLEQTFTDKTYNYEFRKLIDNTQLLFAIRNTNLDKEKNVYATIPTVSASYGASKDISVKLNNQLSENFNLSYTKDNTTIVETGAITYNHVSFIVGTTTNTGAAQYLKIQADKSNSLPYNALVLEYAETLTSYGTPACLGALVYTLKSVEIN